jgi:hypothetical protein
MRARGGRPGRVTDQDLRLVLQTALLGEVGPALRGVAYRLDEREVGIRFYFDGPVSDEDRESASCVVTEVIASLPEDVRVVEEVIRLDAPARLPDDLRHVFHRRG